jgi:hypothetical protein
MRPRNFATRSPLVGPSALCAECRFFGEPRLAPNGLIFSWLGLWLGLLAEPPKAAATSAALRIGS